MSLRGLVWVNCTWGVWLCLPWLPKGGTIIHQRLSLVIGDQAKTCRILFWYTLFSFLKRDSLWEPCHCPRQGISRKIIKHFKPYITVLIAFWGLQFYWRQHQLNWSWLQFNWSWLQLKLELAQISQKCN